MQAATPPITIHNHIQTQPDQKSQNESESWVSTMGKVALVATLVVFVGAASFYLGYDRGLVKGARAGAQEGFTAGLKKGTQEGFKAGIERARTNLKPVFNWMAKQLNKCTQSCKNTPFANLINPALSRKTIGPLVESTNSSAQLIVPLESQQPCAVSNALLNIITQLFDSEVAKAEQNPPRPMDLVPTDIQEKMTRKSTEKAIKNARKNDPFLFNTIQESFQSMAGAAYNTTQLAKDTIFDTSQQIVWGVAKFVGYSVVGTISTGLAIAKCSGRL